MAIQFSDTTSERNGLIQIIEDYTGTTSATTSSFSLGTKTRGINSAFSRFQALTVLYSGRNQADDSNQTDYPVFMMDLANSQQDYAFLYDASTPPNLIQDIHRVEIVQANGQRKLLKPIDEADVDVALAMFEATDGEPEYYDKTANSLFLYPSPNYSSTNGLILYYSRTPSYFLSTDTTKKPGIPDFFHEYLALRPSYLYCLQNGLSQTKSLKVELDEMVELIKKYYGSRQRDERSSITVDNSNALDTIGFGGWGGRPFM